MFPGRIGKNHVEASVGEDLRKLKWPVKKPLTIGDRVTVGHQVMLHGCIVEDDCLIGIGAIVLNDAKIGRGSVVAAGSLVPERAVVPPDSLVMGVPAKVKRTITPEEKERFRNNLQHYVEKAQIYLDEANRKND